MFPLLAAIAVPGLAVDPFLDVVVARGPGGDRAACAAPIKA